MNKLKILVVLFLLFVVEANYLFKENYYKTIYNSDVQCLNIKKTAYDSNFYRSNTFNLNRFFYILKEKNCAASLLYEFRVKNFKFYSRYTKLIYEFYCDEAAFLSSCSSSLSKWAKVNKQTIGNFLDLATTKTDTNKMFQGEENSCYLILLQAAHNLSLTEIKVFSFFNVKWFIRKNTTNENTIEK